MSDFLFDSLAHPTPVGTWMDRPSGNGFPELEAALTENGFRGACAVGMWGIDGWDPEAFAGGCRKHPLLVPVAGYKPVDSLAIPGELATLRDMGYQGIKLHSRFSSIDVADPLLPHCFESAARLGLVVFWCTFHHCRVEHWPSRDPLASLVDVLRAAPTARVVLLHGGDVDLLRYMQLVRFNDRLLLDLSHTIAKYPGSSLEQDIGFLFKRFDQRICIGTDWPQFSHRTLRDLYEYHADGLPADKRRNIAHLNLARFLGLDDG
jgi:predicted TIM-barrel fold metal-dependent hydrolase